MNNGGMFLYNIFIIIYIFDSIRSDENFDLSSISSVGSVMQPQNPNIFPGIPSVTSMNGINNINIINIFNHPNQNVTLSKYLKSKII